HKYLCGKEGIRGMRCQRCECIIMFRERPRNQLSDVLATILVGVVAYLAVLSLLLNKPGKPGAVAEVKRPVPQKSEEVPGEVEHTAQVQAELEEWARGQMQKRRKRFG